jgi:surface antigen
MNEPKQGDILVFIGDVYGEVGIVVDVGLDGLVRVANGQRRQTVHPHSFISIFHGNEKTLRIAKD